MKTMYLCSLVVLCLALSAGATTINVPSDQSTIQGAINIASDGDTVRVASGTYNETLTIDNKSIALISTSGSASTTIDAGNGDVTLTVGGTLTSGSIVDGFRFVGGNPSNLSYTSGYALTRNCIIDTARYHAVSIHPQYVDAIEGSCSWITQDDLAYSAIALNGGTIDQTITWPVPPTGFCYLITGDIILNDSNAVFSLQPGTVVKGNHDCGFTITTGRIMADYVTFTSHDDDTLCNAGNAASTGASGQWAGISFTENADDGSTLTNCIIRYAGDDWHIAYAGLGINGAQPTIEGCTFNQNNDYDLYVRYPADGYKVKNNLFADSYHWPVFIHPQGVDSILINNTILPDTAGRFDAIALNGGTIDQTITWPVPPTGFCYLITGDIILNDSNAVFSLQPGTVVKGNHDCGFTITTGRIMADHVTFTSHDDDTLCNAGNTASTGASGQWAGISFTENADDGSTLTNCIIRYAGDDWHIAYAGLGINGAQPIIEGCTFNQNNDYDLYVRYPADGYKVKNNLFADSYHWPIFVHPQGVDSILINNTILPDTAGRFDAIALNGGTIDQTITWPVPPTGFCYYLTGDVDLNDSNAVFTLLPGTVVKAIDGCDITINSGRIMADNVTFTSVEDDTLCDAGGGASTGASGQWAGISFTENADDASAITNCIIRYAGDDWHIAYAGLGINSAQPIIEGCTFNQNNDYDLYVRYPADGYKVKNNLFADSYQWPVFIHPQGVDSILHNNTILPTGSYDAIALNGGTIDQTITWPVPPTGFCYYLTGDVDLNDSNAVWTLLPGTVVKATDDCGIAITTGRIMADYVAFTSVEDDTLCEAGGGASTAGPRQWAGFYFTGDADDGSALTNCIIRYAGDDWHTGYSGIRVASANPTFDGCVFQQNDDHAIYCTNSSLPTIKNCSFSGHSVNAVNNTSTDVIVDATGNWWGDNTGPYDPTDAVTGPPDHNPDGLGEAVSDYVEYRPWLGVPDIEIVDPGTGTDLIVYFSMENAEQYTDYEIYWGTELGDYTESTGLISMMNPSFIISDLSENTPYYVAARAYNSGTGFWSAYGYPNPNTGYRPTIPVVLVHGWRSGSVETWDGTGTENDFAGWLSDAGYQNVWIPTYPNCGQFGEDHFDLNAQALADSIGNRKWELQSQTGLFISRVNIVAHSMGGLISRRMIASDLLSNAYVERLVMLGTPNGGTRYGNLSCHPWNWDEPGWGADILCHGPAECEMSSHNMSDFNSLFNSYGTTRLSAVAGNACCGFKYLGKCSDWYCGEFGTFESYNHDGVVAVNSVFAILSDLENAYIRSYQHSELPASQYICNSIVIPVLRDEAPPDDRFMAPESDILRTQESNEQMIYGEIVLADSLTATVRPLHVEIAAALNVWVYSANSDLTVSLTSPVSLTVDSALAESQPEQYVYANESGLCSYSVLAPDSGTWQVTVLPHEIADTAAPIYIFATIESPVTLELAPDADTIFPGEAVTLRASLADGVTPLTACSVSVEITHDSLGTPLELILVDDGAGPDTLADDGTYTALFDETEYSGLYRFRCAASGVNTQGAAFERFEVAALYASESCCVGLTGNANNDPEDIVDISDLTKLVNYLFLTAEPLVCMEEGNTNGDPEGNVDISDLTKLVNYLFITSEPLAPCQ